VQYTEVGETAAQDFIQTQLVEKSIPFHNPVKKMKQQRFVDMTVKKTIISQHKTVDEIPRRKWRWVESQTVLQMM